MNCLFSITGMMRFRCYYLILLIAVLGVSCDSSDVLNRSEKKILVYNSDPSSGRTFPDINGIHRTDSVEMHEFIQKDSLKYFSAIVLVHPDAKEFSILQKSAIERYLQAGGGVVVINPTVTNNYYWPLLSKLKAQLKEGEIVKKEMEGGRIVLASVAPDSKAMDEKEVIEWIDFAVGDNKYSASSIRSPQAPAPKRFIKKVLDANVNEPVELAVLPDGKVLFIERDGTVKLYYPKDNQTRILDKFDVSMDGNYEDGMLGLALDPAYKTNGWVYIYYSPAGDEPKQNLSRFILYGDSLYKNTEQIILEVPVQRKTCCHSAGSIVFGPDGYLYLSTGDNTSSKESDGYTPIDERPGRSPYDAQKSSGNANDLRGAILRIKVNADGSYSVPEGNLFPKDKKDAKPEIYLMGLRNPYRFTVDPTNGYVYWGDVGPDSGEDSKLGPRSYDEFNQAREAGNYGWPYFVADNKAYAYYDFATREIGPYFDPERPVNQSPNNTGDTILPPAKKSMIWYPYNESAEFPQLGIGSRAAMSGPLYYSHLYSDNSRVKFPDYYNGKWFIYDWARSWVKVVTLDDEDNLASIEDFLPGVEFHKPIDIEFGPDGAMYLLEYGANYFANNPDATLSKIEYAGTNMLPVPIIKADKTVGSVPLKVNFSAKDSYDYDGDDLTFEWFFAGNEVQATGPDATFIFEKPGKYTVKLKATDTNGESAISEEVVKVGNEEPVITVKIDKNRSFFFDNDAVSYEVAVSDHEDGNTANGKISSEDVIISFDYLPHGKDLGLIEPQATTNIATLRGKKLIDKSDCKSCHAMEAKSVGPSYMEIAERYKGDPSAVEFLGQKIIDGGKGNWGESLMAAHPQHTAEETEEMTKYILSLNDEKSAGMPLKGTLHFNRHADNEESGAYILSARYTDTGGEVIGPLTAVNSIILRHPKMQAEDCDEDRGVSKLYPDGEDLAFVKVEKPGAFIKLDYIDMTNVKGLELKSRGTASGTIKVREGSLSGKELGTMKLEQLSGAENWKEVTMNIRGSGEVNDIYFVFEGNFEEETFHLDWIRFLPEQNESHAAGIRPAGKK